MHLSMSKRKQTGGCEKAEELLEKVGLLDKKMIIRTVYQGTKAARRDCEGAGDESGYHAV